MRRQNLTCTEDIEAFRYSPSNQHSPFLSFKYTPQLSLVTLIDTRPFRLSQTIAVKFRVRYVTPPLTSTNREADKRMILHVRLNKAGCHNNDGIDL